MRTLKHVRLVTQTPEQAQISNFEVKLDFTTSFVDRLLLMNRQGPWKIVPGAGIGITDDIDIDDIDTTGLI